MQDIIYCIESDAGPSWDLVHCGYRVAQSFASFLGGNTVNDCSPDNEQYRGSYLLGLLDIGKQMQGSGYLMRRSTGDSRAISLVASGELADRIDALLDEFENGRREDD